MAKFLKKIKVSIRNKILAGVLALIPVAITIYIIRLFVLFFDRIASPVIDKFIHFQIPGLGLIVSIILIYFLGVFVTNILGRKLFQLLEKWLNYIPLVRTVYHTTKQILGAFSVSKSGFEKVVFLEYPRRGVWTLGFVTGRTTGKDGTKFYCLFIPTTPNPTSGWALFIPEDEVIPSEMSVERGLKTLISGGSITPPKVNLINRAFEAGIEESST